jgi:N-acetylglucosamine-6-sulfatase
VAGAAVLLALAALIACGGGGPAAPNLPGGPAGGPPPARPNFVVILADDMATGLFGAGRRHPGVELRNLERLAARGVQFENAFVTTSLCGPSRASLLTGLYAHTHGVVTNEAGDIPSDLATYPQLLRGAGYRTAYVGKWHLDQANAGPRPGFDYWLSFHGQGVYDDPVLNENGVERRRSGYMTDLLTDSAAGWLREQTPDRPFLLVLAHKAAHAPFEPAPRHTAAFADLQMPEPANFRDDYAGKPAWQRRYVRCGGTASAFTQCPDPQPARVPGGGWAARDAGRIDYMRTLLGLDESVGTLVDTLQARGLDRNTYVLFMSDNGFFLGEHRLGDKRLAYEESIRVPMVMAGPGLAPRVVGGMALNIDVAPTLLELAGLGAQPAMQGRSLVKMLRGELAGVRDSFLYEYGVDGYLPAIPAIQAVRTGGRIYVRYPGRPGEEELYDFASDPRQVTNLAARPEWQSVRDGLRQLLDRQLTETSAR